MLSIFKVLFDMLPYRKFRDLVNLRCSSFTVTKRWTFVSGLVGVATQMLKLKRYLPSTTWMVTEFWMKMNRGRCKKTLKDRRWGLKFAKLPAQVNIWHISNFITRTFDVRNASKLDHISAGADYPDFDQLLIRSGRRFSGQSVQTACYTTLFNFRISLKFHSYWSYNFQKFTWKNLCTTKIHLNQHKLSEIC